MKIPKVKNDHCIQKTEAIIDRQMPNNRGIDACWLEKPSPKI